MSKETFPAARVADYDNGDTVTLTDGREGYVVGRCFSITPGGQTQVEHYSVMLTLGRGRVAARPETVKRRTTTLRSAA